MVNPTAHTSEPNHSARVQHDDRFAEIRSVILAARRSPDLHRALCLTSVAVRQLNEHRPASLAQIDAAWFDTWQTTIRDLGDLLEHGLVPASEQLSDTDPLTGLGNRRALDRSIADVVRASAAAGAVAMIDLDRFKTVNDTRSHAAGDAVLVAVAETLRTSLRTAPPSRDTITRYGGDEFVAILPATPLPVAVAALQRATRAVAALPTARSHGVTLSVGVATLGPGDNPAASLLAADAAMYAAKRNGGNAVRCATDAR
jgi:diguanylate cyclase (GGDEF)-like protein